MALAKKMGSWKNQPVLDEGQAKSNAARLSMFNRGEQLSWLKKHKEVQDLLWAALGENLSTTLSTYLEEQREQKRSLKANVVIHERGMLIDLSGTLVEISVKSLRDLISAIEEGRVVRSDSAIVKCLREKVSLRI